MVGIERIIKFRCGLLQVLQVVPGNGWEIMMLVVVANIHLNPVKNSVVAIRFLVALHQVMLLYPACADGMQPNGEKEREEKIKQGHPSKEIHDDSIKKKLHHPILYYPSVITLHLCYAECSGQLEGRVQEQPQHLANKIFIDQPRFPVTGNVCIQILVALERMMLDMVNAKRLRAGKRLRKISENSGHAVE